MAKQKPRVGDRAWFVEWCEEIPKDENGDSDMDACVFNEARFESREQALAFAKEAHQKDAFGSVAIWQAELTPYDEDDTAAYPHVGFWETIGDVEHYEGEDE